MGLCRLLVPLDPWRFYEMGRIAEQPFAGRCLDVSSPKLLASLLRHEGKGEWTAIDLFAPEIDRWRHVDPDLRLEVADGRSLPYADRSFDHCVTVSVVEHVSGDGDGLVMAELWRVLAPGGTVHLTTNVSPLGGEVLHESPDWGEASAKVGEKYFFERHYTPAAIDARLLALPWEVVEREYCRLRDPAVDQRFERWAPWSYLWGSALRLSCPDNFLVSPRPDVLDAERHGVLYLKLRKPDTTR